jgi:3-hydroxyisobutyrate dehydrogenase-like beta-hydroxyacid dehydrogenase
MVETVALKPTVGILHLGELGSALAAKFLESGLHVVTTAEHRSERTCQMCAKTGVRCLPTLKDVAELADIVFSVVPADAAMAVAKEFVAHVNTRKGRSVFVDLNSVGPEKIIHMEKLIVAKGHGFVDGIVHGAARSIGHGTVMYFSGHDADYIAGHIPKSIVVRRIAGRAGTNSV